MTENTIAFVGLGSNLAQPRDQVRRALKELEDIPKTAVRARSSFYRSRPLGPKDQPDFINAVAKIRTTLSAHDLLAELFNIENRHGRKRDGTKWGPRELDLDLLIYGDLIISDPDLSLPHPGVTERNFVLLPLVELDPHMVVPGKGPAVDLLNNLQDGYIEKLEFEPGPQSA